MGKYGINSHRHQVATAYQGQTWNDSTLDLYLEYDRGLYNIGHLTVLVSDLHCIISMSLFTSQANATSDVINNTTIINLNIFYL